MKRLHIHLSVDDLNANIRFYSALFESEPSVIHSDYAKWMLEDPKVNFAISARGAPIGLDHLGIQVESDPELSEIEVRLTKAALPVVEQKGTACCYAESDKYWTQDPQGIPWEAFHSLGSIPVFGETQQPPETEEKSACCAPSLKGGCC
ncbi:MAG: hypothetical protein RLZZ627_2051 [Pseudomonadota bacterium]|jgi:catechol 2,3-dioxygenase-like lactoylglutathione lyase family enzyme